LSLVTAIPLVSVAHRTYNYLVVPFNHHRSIKNNIKL